ncbi:MAG: multiheme c-type cytochrome [Nitrospirota bacterium]
MRKATAVMIGTGLLVIAAAVFARTSEYSPSSTCLNCHPAIFKQHEASEHERSFTNPVFQAHYFKELLPKAADDEGLAKEADACTACHAPLAYLKHKKHVTSIDQVDPRMSGVTCDFCHVISGYRGEQPGNGNFIAAPSDIKLGPFAIDTTWHRAYSELHTKSEFCAICHNAVNRHGLEIKSTFTEWKDSGYAQQGIQCQDCHMTVLGFLTGGKAVYESGPAAVMIMNSPAERERIYTHRFPGAHSHSQVSGAVTLDIGAGHATAAPGDEIAITVSVDNSRTGHKFPSGSADLRLLWMEVTSSVDGRPVPVAVVSEAGDGYAVAGKGPSDREILGDDVPEGSRMYRAVFADKEGAQTLSSYNALRAVFDNRLGAGEVRKETYRIKLPADGGTMLSIAVSLRYLPYPSSFAKRLGTPKPEPVEVAAARKDIPLR